MLTLYCVVLDILFVLLNKAFNYYLCNSDFTTYCIHNTLKCYITHYPKVYMLDDHATNFSCINVTQT